jgi:hypothetical protein
LEQDEFQVAVHERRGRLDVDANAEAASGRHCPPDRQGLRLALDPHVGERLVVEQLAGRRPGRLADHHPADRRHPFQTGGGVDHVADHSFGFPASTEGHDRLAGGEADPDRQIEIRLLAVQLLDRLRHRERAPHRPLGVVLVARDAEHRHNPVADELVDHPPEPFGLAAEAHVVGPKACPDVLGIGPVGAGGETGQVAEQHGDDLALLGRSKGAERSTAATAEREPLRGLRTAGGTRPHAA